MRAASQIILTPKKSSGYTYYVDSVNGNDGNSGRTAAKAFQNLTALPTLLTGQSVGLARNSVWKDQQLTLTVPNITIAGYGTGALPLIDCAATISNAGWSLYSAGIYQITLPQQLDPGGASSYWPSMWVSGVRIYPQASLVALGSASAPAFYTAINPVTATVVYYYKTASGNSPATDGLLVEYAHLGWAIRTFDTTGANISNVATRRPYYSSGSVTLGQNSICTNVQANDGNAHSFLLRGGTTLNGCTATDAYAYESQVIPIVWYESTATGLPVTINACGVTLTIANVSGAIGYYGHSTGGYFGTISISNSGFTDAVGASGGAGFGTLNTALFVVNNCATTRAINGVESGADNTLITNFTMNAAPAGSYGAVFLNPNISLDIEGATINLNASVGLNGVVLNSFSGCNLTMHGVTVNTGTYNGIVQGPVQWTGAGGSIVATNNPLLPAAGSLNGWKLPATTTLTADYNVYSNAGGNHATTYQVGGVSYSSWATYLAGTGQDAHSTN